MRYRHSAALPLVAALLWNVPPAAAQQASPPVTAVSAPTSALTPAQMEAFLLNANIIRTRPAGGGITGSLRVTMTDGALTHDAHVQTIDQALSEFKPARGTPEFNFRDSYRYNIAAYRLSLLLGLDNVPMSVERRVNGKNAAVTWWVDDVLMDERARLKANDRGPDSERFAMQTYVQRVFDELIANRDRNLGNMLWTTDWKMWLIDHTRAFRMNDDVQKPQLLVRIDRALFERLQRLTVEETAKAVGASLTTWEVRAIIARRDAIIKHYRARIAERGETGVLFNPRR